MQSAYRRDQAHASDDGHGNGAAVKLRLMEQACEAPTDEARLRLINGGYRLGHDKNSCLFGMLLPHRVVKKTQGWVKLINAAFEASEVQTPSAFIRPSCLQQPTDVGRRRADCAEGDESITLGPTYRQLQMQ